MIGVSTAMRNAAMTARRDFIDAGATPGTLKLYTAPRPATGAAITSQTLIATVALEQPCGTVTDGVLSFAPIDPAAAVAVGEPVWGRFENGDGTHALDVDVGIVGSGAEIEISAGDVTEIGTLIVFVGTPQFTGGNAG